MPSRGLRPELPALACLVVGVIVWSADGRLAARPAQGPGTAWRAGSIGQDFVRIPAGRFTMGSPPTAPGREEQEREHPVTLSRAFLLATTEVTQAQWREIMGSNPSRFADCAACPVEEVDLRDVEAFLARLEAREGVVFRLPTEAEWEYACRAGTDTAFGLGDALTTAQANYDGNYPLPGQPAGEFRARTTPVGSFPANAWGLHDMNGNVWEWTADRHCPYPQAPTSDPRGTCANELFVIRGGSWLFGADSARCALRYTHRPQDEGPSLGFRLARDLPGEDS